MAHHEPEVAEILHVESIRKEYEEYKTNFNESYKAEFGRFPEEDFRRDTRIFYGALALVTAIIAFVALVLRGMHSL